MERLNTLLAFLSYVLISYCCLIVGWHVRDNYVWMSVIAWSFAVFLTILFVMSFLRCRRSGLSLSRLFLSTHTAAIAVLFFCVLCMIAFRDEGWDDFFSVASSWTVLDLVRLQINEYTDMPKL